jgi:alkanesulfonate monooxygenase SsuD/methylene tetrahydromethanopterin reductase-like flavin-dependent oxidoreductase (luciferase family)
VKTPDSLDPKIAGDLFHRYYDEFQLADELGLDIMLNEHHQTATCMSATVIVGLSVLARITKRARLLVLGYPIGHRPDPLRCAEELSTIDVISRGRLDMGFIKGVPYEFAASNANPVGVMDRFWDAHDFIIKAMTSHDGPFNWESEHFHYRQVNIWPRPWQQPHPPVWSTTASKSNARVLGERGYVMAVLGSGYNTRSLYDAYREGYASKRNGAVPPPDRFAYLALFAIARDEPEARRRGELVAGYLRTGGNVYPAFKNPPGYLSVDDTARILRGQTPDRSFTKDGRVIDMRTGSVQDLIDSVLMFCGTPDQVYQQIVDFVDYTGGLGNLLIMAQGGHLNHTDTADQLTLMAKEVMPRLKEYKQPVAEIAAA